MTRPIYTSIHSMHLIMKLSRKRLQRAKGRGGKMASRERNIQVKFRVTPEERRLIESRMVEFGTKNMGAYLRKMAIDGYIVKLNFKELSELLSLLRRVSASVNQIAKRINSTGRVYSEDLAEIKDGQEEIYEALNRILKYITNLR